MERRLSGIGSGNQNRSLTDGGRSRDFKRADDRIPDEEKGTDWKWRVASTRPDTFYLVVDGNGSVLGVEKNVLSEPLPSERQKDWALERFTLKNYSTPSENDWTSPKDSILGSRSWAIPRMKKNWKPFRYGLGATIIELPLEDNWLFDFEEDYSPNGSSYTDLRERMILDYAKLLHQRRKDGVKIGPLGYEIARQDYTFNDLSAEAKDRAIEDYIEGYADGTYYEEPELPTKNEAYEILDKDLTDNRYKYNGILTVVEGKNVNPKLGMRNYDIFTGDEEDSLKSPYRVEVQWRDELADFGSNSELPSGTKVLFDNQGNPVISEDGVAFQDLTGIGNPVKFASNPPKSSDFEEWRIPPESVSFSAWSEEEAREIYNKLQPYEPDYLAVLASDNFSSLDRWSVIVNENGDHKIIESGETGGDETQLRRDYYEKVKEAILELNEKAEGDRTSKSSIEVRKGQQKVAWFEMSGDDARDMFYESSSEGEINWKDVFETGAFEVGGYDSRGAEMMSSKIDLTLNPTIDGGGGWSMDEDEQTFQLGLTPGRTVLFELLGSEGPKLRDPSYISNELHSFDVLNSDNENLTSAFDWFEKGYYGKRMPPSFDEDYSTLIRSFNQNGGWVFDANDDTYEGELVGLPYDLKYVGGELRPVILPDGEITFRPSMFVDGDEVTWGGLSHPSKLSTWQDTPKVNLSEWDNVKIGRGKIDPSQIRFSDKTFKFSRSYKDSKGRTIKYESKPAGKGLVVWKNKEYAKTTARRARELGWLVRTVPVGNGWVNIANPSRLKARYGKSFNAKGVNTYYRRGLR